MCSDKKQVQERKPKTESRTKLKNQFSALSDVKGEEMESNQGSTSTGSESPPLRWLSSASRSGLNEKSLLAPRKDDPESWTYNASKGPGSFIGKLVHPLEESKDKAEKKMKTPKGFWKKDKAKKKIDLNLLGKEEEVDELDQIASCKDEGFTWVKEEAAVDSGAVDCVANKKRFPHLNVTPTPESIRGESWTCAGGKKLPKEGEVALEWFTNEGDMHKTNIKIGSVSRTLISADRLLEKGNDVILSKNNPRIVKRNGGTIPLQRRNGMFLLSMWYKVPTSSLGFTRQGS